MCTYVYIRLFACVGIGTARRLIRWKIPVPTRKTRTESRRARRFERTQYYWMRLSQTRSDGEPPRRAARIRSRHPTVLQWGNRANRGEPWIFISLEDSPVVASQEYLYPSIDSNRLCGFGLLLYTYSVITGFRVISVIMLSLCIVWGVTE